MSKILVTGGCGYIGSHTLVSLIENGYKPISVDSLVNSYEESLEGVFQITGERVLNYKIDLSNKGEVAELFRTEKGIVGVIHFAALKAVGESVKDPILYFRNNMNALINVLDQAIINDVKNIIFSSSCTVYGQATDLPVTEHSEMKEAESPYGRTKQIGEYVLKDLSLLKDLKSLSLRYFNPAGAHPSALIGEASRVPALNLVPVITETANGKRDKCIVNGNDYPTRDGTNVRDYIHVMDLAHAHTMALQFLMDKNESSYYDIYNLGIGEGVTVLEAIEAFEKVSGKKLHYEIGPRREGDVIAIYSNYDKAKRDLGWEPSFSIEDIMSSAWRWELERRY